MAQATYPAIPDVARVDLVYFVSGTPSFTMMNSFYVRNTVTARDNAYLAALAASAEAGWAAELQGEFSTGVSFSSVRVTDLNTELRPSVETFPGLQGTNAGNDALTVGCAVVQLLGTVGGFPKRSYIRHLALEQDTGGNSVATAAAARIATSYEDFIADLTVVVADALVIVSPFEPDGVPPNIYRDEGVSNTVDAVTVRETIGRSVSRQR